MLFLAKTPSQSKVAKEPIGVSFGPIFTPKDVHKSSKNQKKFSKYSFNIKSPIKTTGKLLNTEDPKAEIKATLKIPLLSCIKKA